MRDSKYIPEVNKVSLKSQESKCATISLAKNKFEQEVGETYLACMFIYFTKYKPLKRLGYCPELLHSLINYFGMEVKSLGYHLSTHTKEKVIIVQIRMATWALSH